MTNSIFSNLPIRGKTMSSLEIAEITGKQHQHIMRDIRSLLEQGVDASNFGLTSYTDKANRQKPCYQLTKKGSLLLASGYDALLRERIIDRWEVLETERVSEELNPSKSMDKAIVAYKRQGKSDDWIRARFEGQEQRHAYTDTLQSHGVTGSGYARCTNAIYFPILKCDAKGFKKRHNLPQKANPRDNMTMVELMAVGLSEALASEGIVMKNVHGTIECVKVSNISATNVANAIDVSRRQIA
jgi:Rha family phage regulatory protein